MASYLRLYATGAGADIYIPMIKRSVVDFAVSGDWTPVAGDVKVSIDGAAAANIATLPVAVTMGNGAMWKFVFSNAELTGKFISVTIVDAATKAVEDQMFTIDTYGNASAQHVLDLSTTISAQVWNTQVTAGTASGTFGLQLNGLRCGTAQAGGASTITLDASASATNQVYTHSVIGISGGTGRGQSSIITDYQGGTKVATVNDAWAIVPDNTSKFAISALGSIPGASAPTSAQNAAAVWDLTRAGHSTAGTFGEGVASVQGNVTGNVAGSIGSVASGGIVAASFSAGGLAAVGGAAWNEAYSGHVTAGTFGRLFQAVRDGTAQAGGASAITLDAGANSNTDWYKGDSIVLISGTGAGQGNTINAYNGSTKVASVQSPWITVPDATTVWVIYPGDPSSTTQGIINGLWNEPRASHVTAGSFGEGVASVQGNVTGNVAGSVGSVTGAVASVTGNIGGNVNGNVVGSVASVTGNVGGNLVGNVNGTVATVTTVNGIAAAERNAVADALLDRSLAGHVTAGSVGVALQLSQSGTAQAGGATTITLAAGAVATDQFYKFNLIYLVAGTGAGQGNLISNYVGATRVATVVNTWVVNPDNTSVYATLPVARAS